VPPAVAFKYLLDYIRDKGITSPDPWVDRDTFERVAESAKETGLAHPMKIVTELNGGVGYDDVRIAMACLENVV
jgi:hypothetical protein